MFSPGWDLLGREAEVILERYLGSTYKAVQAPREAVTASTKVNEIWVGGLLFRKSFKINSLKLLKKPPRLKGPVMTGRFGLHGNQISFKVNLISNLYRIPLNSFLRQSRYLMVCWPYGPLCQNPNPLLLPQFKKEDARWRVTSSSAQTSLRLATNSTALLDTPLERRSYRSRRKTVLISVPFCLRSQNYRLFKRRVPRFTLRGNAVS